MWFARKVHSCVLCVRSDGSRGHMFGKMGRMFAIYVERGQRACSRMLSELLFEPLGVL